MTLVPRSEVWGLYLLGVYLRFAATDRRWATVPGTHRAAAEPAFQGTGPTFRKQIRVSLADQPRPLYGGAFNGLYSKLMLASRS